MSVEHGSVKPSDVGGKAALTELAFAKYELLDSSCSLARVLCAAMEAHPGFVPCEHAFYELVEGLSLSLVAQTCVEVEASIERIHARRAHVADHRSVDAPEATGIAKALSELDATSPQRVKIALLAALQALAPYVLRSFELDVVDKDMLVTMARAATLLADADADFKVCLAMEKELGKALQKALYLGL